MKWVMFCAQVLLGLALIVVSILPSPAVVAAAVPWSQRFALDLITLCAGIWILSDAVEEVRP